MEEATMRRRVATAPVGRLGTVTADGRPHLVPCCFAVDLDREVLYSAVDSKPKSTRRLRRLANVEAHPATSLLVDHYAADWARLWWVRLDGTGRVIYDGAGDEPRRALAMLTAKYPQYRRNPPAGPVLAVDITGWHAWP
ncbi:MAG TPA: TIGR03668 family PPOX class F420-dependent oxidoreductase [Acidimicrobiales bacterium]|nr:TIGR03668 family PPOX class F420-dependent oxidoreductase [Acidimicrobiales bacterium]